MHALINCVVLQTNSEVILLYMMNDFSFSSRNEKYTFLAKSYGDPLIYELSFHAAVTEGLAFLTAVPVPGACYRSRARAPAVTRRSCGGEFGNLPHRCQPNLAILKIRGKRLVVYTYTHTSYPCIIRCNLYELEQSYVVLIFF